MLGSVAYEIIFRVNIASEHGNYGKSSGPFGNIYNSRSGFEIVRKIRDKFGQLLMIGLGSIIALQAFFHIAAISGIIPLTGMPLPFISYGGSSLAIFMTISGIMVNISKYT